PLELVVSSIGYRGPQFWKSGDSWKDQWGSNIYHSKDGGQSWVGAFQYYGIDGGDNPTFEQMDENGIGWMFNSSIHWSGSVVFDPFNSNKVWVTSGNGVFASENVKDYEIDDSESWNIKLIQRSKWKVMSHGIEETVPGEVVSIPGGPLVSVILDYDGFRHNDIAKYPPNRHLTNVGGSNVSLGNTRAIAYAPKSGRLVKVSDSRVHEEQYNDIPISPIQISNDSGSTWSVDTYPNGLNSSLKGGTSVAISADGEVVLWTPLEGTTEGDQPVQRYANSTWSTVSGIDGSYIVGDPENENVFYAYNRKTGKMSKSTGKGTAFSEVSSPGASDFQKFRLAPNREGDIWLPLTNNGLARSKNGGSTFSPISTVSYCEAVGFGKAAEGKTFPTVFIFGTVDGVTGVFMSTDEGESWIRANDDGHQYGGLANGEFVVGDMNVYSRVYMSTAGHGIVYGEITGTTTPVKAAIAATDAIKLKGTELYINADNRTTHNIRIFDLKGKQVYNSTVSGSTVLSMNRVLSNGIYVVSVRKGGTVVYSGKVSILPPQ
ncbi:MAG: T9SS type A sorting domain-containing protein, partial [Fibromonadaceae bacterium]|nr:T9SS type A sorting domain-containing protein [Fibromonadaceae bacterium]